MNKDNIKKYAIILAAGVGSRMKSNLPKCAVNFCGLSMVERIVNECEKCNFDEIVVIVGYKKDYIINILQDRVKYIYQDKQLGTAHAILCSKEYFQNKDGICVIIPGDMPLIDNIIINNIINNHINSLCKLSIVTCVVSNPYSYGRILRINKKVKKIVEEVDANEYEKTINEINSGIYCIDIKLLFTSLLKVKNNNKRKEYYFTDIVEIISENYNINTIMEEENYKLCGVNDLETLLALEKIFKEKKK